MIKVKIIRESSDIKFGKKIKKLLMKNWELKGNFKIDNKNHICQMLIKITAGKK